MKIESGMMNTAAYTEATVRPEAKPKAEPQPVTIGTNQQPVEVLPFGKGTGVRTNILII